MKSLGKTVALLISFALIAAGVKMCGAAPAARGTDETNAEKPKVEEREAAVRNDAAEKESRKVGRLIEIPAKLKGKPEKILKRLAYTVSFNRETNEPNWVAWCLEDNETDGHVRRSDKFFEDDDVAPQHRVEYFEYSGSGYERGHMAPAADMRFSGEAMHECFYMTNICPQTHKLNAGAWNTLENACRRWAEKYERVYIVCGPLFEGSKHKTVGKCHKVAVPEAFFKCVYAEIKGRPQAMGFIMRNSNAKQKMNDCAMTVDEVEEMTGMDFFPNLPDKIEDAVEKTYSLKTWQ